MIYLKTFAISAPLFALFYHWIAIEPMPWWPDTAIMGAFMGALATFAVIRFRPAAIFWRGVARKSLATFQRLRRN